MNMYFDGRIELWICVCIRNIRQMVSWIDSMQSLLLFMAEMKRKYFHYLCELFNGDTVGSGRTSGKERERDRDGASKFEYQLIKSNSTHTSTAIKDHLKQLEEKSTKSAAYERNTRCINPQLKSHALLCAIMFTRFIN